MKNCLLEKITICRNEKKLDYTESGQFHFVADRITITGMPYQWVCNGERI